MRNPDAMKIHGIVLPLTREWIEMMTTGLSLSASKFSLLRGSGLKFSEASGNLKVCVVLPLTREWIEIFCHSVPYSRSVVLPLTREWIEMSILGFLSS